MLVGKRGAGENGTGALIVNVRRSARTPATVSNSPVRVYLISGSRPGVNSTGIGGVVSVQYVLFSASTICIVASRPIIRVPAFNIGPVPFRISTRVPASLMYVTV